MKSFLIKKLEQTLRWLAQKTIQRYRPGIIGVTGSVGKTSTKEALLAMLQGHRRVRANFANFNNEIGVPLTILGEWHKIEGTFFWMQVIFQSLKQLIIKNEYPEIIIIEYAAGKPGDLQYLLNIAKPNIAIVTAVGQIPVHIEFYSGADAVAREKARLVEAVPKTGFAILNFDDEAVLNMRSKARGYAITYGFGEGADIRITGFEYKLDRDPRSGSMVPIGVSFKLEHGGAVIPVKLHGVLGKSAAYAAAAATAVGIIYGMNLVKISDAMQTFEAPAGRMKLVAGVKNTVIIDDAYNAAPMSMHAAVDALKAVHGQVKRTIAVLGDMLEIGKYAPEAHERVGELAAEACDVLFTVGPRAKFIAEAAAKVGMKRESIQSFATADQAKRVVQEIIREGDVILVKGSRAIQLEKVVEEIEEV